MFTVLIEDRAKDDIQEAIYYYDQINLSLGIKFEKAIDKELLGLEKHSFYQIRYKGIRCKLIKNFPYLLHFSVDEDERLVKVYALICTLKDPERSWL